MNIPQDLTAHLAALSSALDDPATDLQAMLAVLIDDLLTAVPSFVGLTMTIPTNGYDGDRLTLNVLPPERAAAVSTSLLLPLDAIGIADTGGTVVFYAARPGAFVDLAADTRFAYGLDGQVKVDEHLPSVGPPAELSGVALAQTSTINRAIGVLLDRGHTPQDALAMLQRRAEQDGVTVARAARQLLDTAVDKRPPTP